MAQKAEMAPVPLQARMFLSVQSSVFACLQIIPVKYDCTIEDYADMRVIDDYFLLIPLP